MKWFIPLLILIMIGCATPRAPCPSQDAVIGVRTQLGDMTIVIPQGHLDKEKCGKTWITKEEFEEIIRKEMEKNKEKL